jgi:hypothetical protein
MGAILTTGAVFLHVPKTGGSWVASVLENEEIIKRWFPEKHADRLRLNILESIYWPKRPPSFCFVRHPISWYESWYRYQCQEKFNWLKWGYKPHHPCTPLDGLGDYNFNRFISNVIDAVPGFVSLMYRDYTDGTTFVGRQENLISDLFKALEKTCGYRLKKYISLSRINASNKRRIDWDPILKGKIIELEQDAIDQWYSE